MVITRHAQTRIQQRGCTKTAVDLVILLHDKEVFVGDGCQAWSLSREKLAALRDTGFPPSVLDRTRNLILIVEAHRKAVCTVVKGGLRNRARRLRRQGNGRWRK